MSRWWRTAAAATQIGRAALGTCGPDLLHPVGAGRDGGHAGRSHQRPNRSRPDRRLRATRRWAPRRSGALLLGGAMVGATRRRR
jgi:hypothetical protein